MLVQREVSERETRNAFSEEERRADHQIIRHFAAVLRARPSGRKAKLGPRRKRQRVRAVGEHHQALDVMIAVRAAAKDAQREVDLGARGFSECHSVCRL